MNKDKKISTLDWHYTRWGGVIAVILVKVWLKLHRKPLFKVELNRPIDQNEPTIIISNHQQYLDPPAIFSALSLRSLIEISPVKFMAWHKYYNSVAKPLLYTTGSYPSHGPGLTGVDGAIYFARHRYRSFIFPEGKRIKNGIRTPAYDGIIRILKELPSARIILVRIDWEKRIRFLSRPKLNVCIFDAPENIEKNNADSIMDIIYAKK